MTLVHDPCRRLAELRLEGPRDRPEEAALALCDLLAGSAGVPARALGVTGSLLAGLHYEPLGEATLRARVVDDADALFTPCRYGVTDAGAAEPRLAGRPPTASAADPARAPAEPPPAAPAMPTSSALQVTEIVSFRGRFSEQARRGEWVEARGTLERVVPRAGPATVRLTVGGRAGDYLVSLLSRPA